MNHFDQNHNSSWEPYPDQLYLYIKIAWFDMHAVPVCQCVSDFLYITLQRLCSP